MVERTSMLNGKIGTFPCVEEVVTKRKSKVGHKGTLKAINRKMDSEFYHNYFSEERAVSSIKLRKRAHNGGRKLAENMGSSVDLKVNVDDYNRLKNKLGLKNMS